MAGVSEIGPAVELEMLKEFFDCWEAFHATPKDRLHRHQLERAAQNLLDAANTVRAYRKGEPLVLTLNG